MKTIEGGKKKPTEFLIQGTGWGKSFIEGQISAKHWEVLLPLHALPCLCPTETWTDWPEVEWGSPLNPWYKDQRPDLAAASWSGYG